MLCSDDCASHVISNHPEKPSRVTEVLSMLHDEYRHPAYFREAQQVKREDLMLFHEPSQIDRFISLSERAESSGRKFQIDCDTVVSSMLFYVIQTSNRLIKLVGHKSLGHEKHSPCRLSSCGRPHRCNRFYFSSCRPP